MQLEQTGLSGLGGYTLAREMDAISIAEVIRAVDEVLDATNCGGNSNCEGDSLPCMTHNLWTSLNQKMYEFLPVELIHISLSLFTSHFSLSTAVNVPRAGIEPAWRFLPEGF